MFIAHGQIFMRHSFEGLEHELPRVTDNGIPDVTSTPGPYRLEKHRPRHVTVFHGILVITGHSQHYRKARGETERFDGARQ